jgi:hypothetical protein
VKVALTWMSGFPMMEVMIGFESLSLSLKFRIKIMFFWIRLANQVVIQSNHL